MTAWWEITPQIAFIDAEIVAIDLFIARGEAFGGKVERHRGDRLQLIAVRASLVELRALRQAEAAPPRLRSRPYLLELFTGWRRARG